MSLWQLLDTPEALSDARIKDLLISLPFILHAWADFCTAFIVTSNKKNSAWQADQAARRCLSQSDELRLLL